MYPGVNIRLGGAASRSSVVAALESAGVVDIASHAVANERDSPYPRFARAGCRRRRSSIRARYRRTAFDTRAGRCTGRLPHGFDRQKRSVGWQSRDGVSSRWAQDSHRDVWNVDDVLAPMCL